MNFFQGNMKSNSIWISQLLKCTIVLLLFRENYCLTFKSNSSNVFVEKCRRDCAIQKDAVVCGRYRVVRWLQDVKEKEFNYGPFSVIKVPSLNRETIFPRLPRINDTRSGLIDTLSFVRDAAEDMLTKRAVVYTIEYSPGARSLTSGPIVLDDDEFKKISLSKRGEERIFHKKKKHIILPILILLNLIKLKLLLLPVFLGVHFIKKILVIGSLLLPSILSHLKICKVPHYPVHQAWATAAEAPVDYPTGYGHEESPWIHRNDVQSHIYSGYHAGFSNPYSGYYQGYRQRR